MALVAVSWAHQFVTECPRLAQNSRQVTIVALCKKASLKKSLQPKPLFRRLLAISPGFFSVDLASWPLDCICLYVQVNMCA
jgi:hypothetical protein